MKINIQMYSFMDGEHNDTMENLAIAAELGFDGVELFGPAFAIPAEEIKERADKLNLDIVSMHAPKTGMVEELIPFAKAVGSSYIGIGMETLKDENEIHDFAKELNRIGLECNKSGLMLTYHNHTQEFAKYGEQTILDILMQETDPEFVSFELDAGWAAAAGADPVKFVKEYSGRVRLLHMKESSRIIGPQPPLDFEGLEKDENGMPQIPQDLLAILDEHKKINCPAGEGIVDWKHMIEIAKTNGCEHFIVEREYSDEGKRVEWLKRDLTYYRKNLV